MDESARLLETLKRSLKARGLTYRDVARELDLSESSVKRLFSSGSISLTRVTRICRMLELSVYDLARLARTESEDLPRVLSLEEEQALAREPRLLGCFYLLLNGWSAGRIARRLGLDRSQTTRCLVGLDRLGLIELLPANRVKLRTARSIAWRRDGPVRKRYERQILSEFLGGPFDGALEVQRFESGEISEASMQILRRRIERLLAEMNELVELDMALPAAERQSVGLLIGLRPWVFSLFARGRR